MDGFQQLWIEPLFLVVRRKAPSHTVKIQSLQVHRLEESRGVYKHHFALPPAFAEVASPLRTGLSASGLQNDDYRDMVKTLCLCSFWHYLVPLGIPRERYPPGTRIRFSRGVVNALQRGDNNGEREKSLWSQSARGFKPGGLQRVGKAWQLGCNRDSTDRRWLSIEL